MDDAQVNRSGDEGQRDWLPRRIWKSVFTGPLVPRTDRERRKFVRGFFLLHFRPIQLPSRTLRWTHTFGLGGSALVLVLLLVLTGLLLMFSYQPTPERAWGSIVDLQEGSLFGPLVRSIHHWSANLLVVVALLHLLRVFFTGGFRNGREFNWLVGLFALAFVLGQNFTGYLLPWDQRAYWAVTISTGMVEYLPLLGPGLKEAVRGGSDIGGSTLTAFYALHTTLVPALIFGSLGLHFWRVRKAGGVVIPRADAEEPVQEPEKVLFLPHLFVREASQACVVAATVIVLAAAAGAGLGEAANPGLSPNPAKAPWYFAGFQELLLHFHPTVGVFLIPLAAALALALVPYRRGAGDVAGIFMVSPRGRSLAGLAALTALVATPLWIVADEHWLDPGGWFPALPPMVSEGLIPASILLVLLAIFVRWLRRRRSATGDEAVQAVFVLLAVAFAVLTVTGVWFRGVDMTLGLPFGGAP